jgi:formate dehydrogenase major subunit
MSEIFLTINGKKVAGETGDTILGIALKNGIEIPNLCHADSLKHYGACGLCVVEAEGIPKLLRSCSTEAKDGMVVNSESARAVQARKIALELLMSDHKGDCVGPCSLNCPAGTNCQGYAKAIALGNEYEAVKIIKEKLPLPASIGRVCPHPCETACRRQYVEEPLSIAFLKAYAADTLLKNKKHYLPEIPEATGKTVGIVGGGPAGLTAAYFLKSFGHDVTIYEAMPKMGGMLRYGIPEYRLPKIVLDAEIAEIASLGVRMKNDVKIGETTTFEDIKKAHDAVLVAIGAWTSMKIGCKGEELAGVVGGIDFLREVALGNKPAIGDNVAVVGGGNTAMDACRSAIRLGAKNVYVIYRRTQAEMPAEEVEYKEACEEGVTFKFLTNPDEIIGEGGKATKIKLQIMRLGEPDASGRRSPVPVEGKFEYLDVDPSSRRSARR